MAERLVFPLSLLALLGSGLIAGVFFAFSSFVMRALARLPAPQGLAAMQSINVVVLNPLFLGVFVGTAILCIGSIVMAWLRGNEPGAAWMLIGAMLYLVGCFGVTVVFNVPLNETLAGIRSTDSVAAEQWGAYVRRWTLWNHIRMIASLSAAAFFAVGLCSH